MKNPKKPKLTRLLTNDLETAYEEIVATYDARWEMESLQATETELPVKVFLWRERQRHQNTDLGDTDNQSVADAAAKEHYAVMELLRACYNGQDNAHVLY